jgi:hypothetical protein
VIDAFQRVERDFGKGEDEVLMRWAVLLWGELRGEVWDWFAYQTAFAIWYGQLRHGGVDILELGGAGQPLLQAFQNQYIDRRARFEASGMSLRNASLSEWDIRTMRTAMLTLDTDPGDSWRDLIKELGEPVRRAGFQAFWAEELQVLELPLQVAVRDRTMQILDQQGVPFPGGRQLPLPRDLQTIPKTDARLM